MDEGQRSLRFCCCRRTTDRASIRPLDSFRIVCGLIQQVPSEFVRRIHDEFGVQHQQGLRRDNGRVTVARRHRWVGKIKLLEQRVKIITHDREINGASQAVVFRVVDRRVIEDELLIA